jgi:chromosome segregation ATPase
VNYERWKTGDGVEWIAAARYDALATSLAQLQTVYDEAAQRASNLAAELAEWQRMRNEAMAQATFNRNGIDKLTAELTHAKQARNDECRLRQGAEARYAEIAAELAGLRREHQRVWEEKKTLEAALRKYGIHTLACASLRSERCDCGWTKCLLSNFATESEVGT